MSRFYASITSDKSKGQATKCGHKWMSAHVRGWNVGARIEIFQDQNGKDTVRVFQTAGSNGNGSDELIGDFQDVLSE